MASDTTTTTISNRALARIGAKRISAYNATATTGEGYESVQCRTHYNACRLALLRSYPWNFAKARVVLNENGHTPVFEWNYECDLPDDFIRMRGDYNVGATTDVDERWEIEGDKVLTDDSTVQLEYTKDEDDPTKFDDLYIELLVLEMAQKMLFPLAGTSNITLNMMDGLQKELRVKHGKAKTVHRNEENTSGRSDWNFARRSNRVWTEEGRVYGGV